MKCKICSNEANLSFTKLVLHRYSVKYYQCSSCSFIQTEKPYWLDEAYASAITSLDIGLVYRNIYLRPIIQAILLTFFDRKERFLDFAGGYGLFVRMMRDNGFDFFRQDKYCENLFAKSFDLNDLESKSGFEAVTAFEIFEHLANPYDDIKEMLTYSDTIIFSTDLVPSSVPVEQWEYLAPEVGQHVAFYHYKSLQVIAKKLQLNVYSNGVNVHMLSMKKINPMLFKQITRPRISRLINIFASKSTLLETDYQFIKRGLLK